MKMALNDSTQTLFNFKKYNYCSLISNQINYVWKIGLIQKLSFIILMWSWSYMQII